MCLAEELKPSDYIWTYYTKVYYLAKVVMGSKYCYNSSDEIIQNDVYNQLTNINGKQLAIKLQLMKELGIDCNAAIHFKDSLLLKIYG